MATREEIDRVLSAVNIVDTISLHVALRRQGDVWKGLCPFHIEKTSSFTVNPGKGMFYCFGCQKGGDAVKFLQEIEGLTFTEALTRLADSVGIKLSQGLGTDPLAGKRERLFLALEAATQFYQTTLQHTQIAQNYLSERCMKPETIQKFRVGYSGESADAFVGFLRRKGVQIEDAIEAGILAKGDPQYGSVWDKLKGRIIFPIVDIHDRPIAFGGRLMQDIKDKAKYLNTAETGLFSKGKTFYGMSHARKSIVESGYAVVVEGYFDVAAAQQGGFTNVVATLGTALTENHADQLSRHTQQVRLAFDSDTAGLRAASKSALLFEQKELDALVLDLPKGEDPDSLLRHGRSGEFQTAIENARPIREFKLRTILELISSKQRTETDSLQLFKREIMPVLLGTKSVIEQDRYIRLCAPAHPMYSQGAALAEFQIRQEIESATGNKPSSKSSTTITQNSRWSGSKARFGGQRNTLTTVSTPPPSGIDIAEENLLKAMGSDDGEIRKLVADGVQVLGVLKSDVAKRLAQRLSSIESASPRILGSLFNDEGVNERDEAVESLVLRIFTGASSNAPLTKQVVLDSLARLQRESLAGQERSLKALADSGDDAASEELLRTIRDAHKVVVN